MFRLQFFALTVGLTLGSGFAQAQSSGETSPQPATQDAVRASIASVAGLAPDDQLNIRASASALGKTLGRLPNGSVVNRYECEMVNGYEWCRVSSIEDASLSGWAPSRYLLTLSVEENSTAAIADDTPGAQEREPDSTSQLPPALAERFADEPVAPAELTESHVANLQTRLRAPASEPAAVAPEPAIDPSIPTPTPRPGSSTVDTPLAVAQTVPPARTETAPETSFSGPTPFASASRTPEAPVRSIPPDATGEIPCARYIGQPMTRCTVSVMRRNDKDADLSIAWPDGGFRIIEFRDGEPSRANSRGEFRYTKEGPLHMIRVGVSERFEIVEAIAFGD